MLHHCDKNDGRAKPIKLRLAFVERLEELVQDKQAAVQIAKSAPVSVTCSPDGWELTIRS